MLTPAQKAAAVEAAHQKAGYPVPFVPTKSIPSISSPAPSGGAAAAPSGGAPVSQTIAPKAVSETKPTVIPAPTPSRVTAASQMPRDTVTVQGFKTSVGQPIYWQEAQAAAAANKPQIARTGEREITLTKAPAGTYSFQTESGKTVTLTNPSVGGLMLPSPPTSMTYAPEPLKRPPALTSEQWAQLQKAAPQAFEKVKGKEVVLSPEGFDYLKYLETQQTPMSVASLTPTQQAALEKSLAPQIKAMEAKVPTTAPKAMKSAEQLHEEELGKTFGGATAHAIEAGYAPLQHKEDMSVFGQAFEAGANFMLGIASGTASYFPRVMGESEIIGKHAVTGGYIAPITPKEGHWLPVAAEYGIEQYVKMAQEHPIETLILPAVFGGIEGYTRYYRGAENLPIFPKSVRETLAEKMAKTVKGKGTAAEARETARVGEEMVRGEERAGTPVYGRDIHGREQIIGYMKAGKIEYIGIVPKVVPKPVTILDIYKQAGEYAAGKAGAPAAPVEFPTPPAPRPIAEIFKPKVEELPAFSREGVPAKYVPPVTITEGYTPRYFTAAPELARPEITPAVYTFERPAWSLGRYEKFATITKPTEIKKIPEMPREPFQPVSFVKYWGKVEAVGRQKGVEMPKFKQVSDYITGENIYLKDIEEFVTKAPEKAKITSEIKGYAAAEAPKAMVHEAKLPAPERGIFTPIKEAFKEGARRYGWEKKPKYGKPVTERYLKEMKSTGEFEFDLERMIAEPKEKPVFGERLKLEAKVPLLWKEGAKVTVKPLRELKGVGVAREYPTPVVKAITTRAEARTRGLFMTAGYKTTAGKISKYVGSKLGREKGVTYEIKLPEKELQRQQAYDLYLARGEKARGEYIVREAATGATVNLPKHGEPLFIKEMIKYPKGAEGVTVKAPYRVFVKKGTSEMTRAGKVTQRIKSDATITVKSLMEKPKEGAGFEIPVERGAPKPPEVFTPTEMKGAELFTKEIPMREFKGEMPMPAGGEVPVPSQRTIGEFVSGKEGAAVRATRGGEAVIEKMAAKTPQPMAQYVPLPVPPKIAMGLARQYYEAKLPSVKVSTLTGGISAGVVAGGAARVRARVAPEMEYAQPKVVYYPVTTGWQPYRYEEKLPITGIMPKTPVELKEGRAQAPILTPITRVKVGETPFTGGTPKTAPVIAQTPAELIAPTAGVKQIQTPYVKETTWYEVFKEPVPKEEQVQPTYTFTTYEYPPFKFPIPPIPPIPRAEGGGDMGKWIFGRQPRVAKGYKPSLGAIVTQKYGKPLKGTLTGLEMRPIPSAFSKMIAGGAKAAKGTRAKARKQGR